jgi:hypothetical protein
MWDELARGAVGAIVLVDLRRIDESFAAIDYFESRRMPFVVAVNTFPGTAGHEIDAVRAALTVSPDVPVVRIDARDAEAAQGALVRLVEHSLQRVTAPI